jgi:hypothetical protein
MEEVRGLGDFGFIEVQPLKTDDLLRVIIDVPGSMQGNFRPRPENDDGLAGQGRFSRRNGCA